LIEIFNQIDGQRRIALVVIKIELKKNAKK